MKCLAIVVAVLLLCSPAKSQTATDEVATLKAKVTQLTATQIPDKLSDCSEHCLLQLANLACIDGVESWTINDMKMYMPKGAGTLYELMHKLSRHCRVVPAQAGTGAKKAMPTAVRGSPKCAQGVFNTASGRCEQVKTTAHQTKS